MTDFVDVDVKIKIANNAERDPILDRITHQMNANRANGYARENDRWIIAAADEIALDFDAFALDGWVECLFINEGAQSASVTLSDASGDFTIPLPADACILLRHFNNSTPGSPKVESSGGTTVRMFAWGTPYTTPA